MYNKFINYFQKITALSDQEVEALKESMIIKTFKKGSFLLKEGQMKEDTYFVLEGGVRQYKIIEGNEITTNFYTEEQWIIFLESFKNPVVSSDYLVCFEDTTLVVGDEEAAQEIFKKFPRFETLSRKVVENAFLEQQQVMTTYITNTPEQRYLKLMQERPDLLQKVPQYHIASYIGVKPESLSRIRKKMTQK